MSSDGNDVFLAAKWEWRGSTSDAGEEVSPAVGEMSIQMMRRKLQLGEGPVALDLDHLGHIYTDPLERAITYVSQVRLHGSVREIRASMNPSCNKPF